MCVLCMCLFTCVMCVCLCVLYVCLFMCVLCMFLLFMIVLQITYNFWASNILVLNSGWSIVFLRSQVILVAFIKMVKLIVGVVKLKNKTAMVFPQKQNKQQQQKRNRSKKRRKRKSSWGFFNRFSTCFLVCSGILFFSLAETFVKQKLPELLRSYIDSGKWIFQLVLE